MVLAVIALVFVVLPLAEIAVAVQVAHSIGVPDTLGLILLFSIVGAWLAWHIGFSVLRRTRDQVARGVVPTNELIDAALVFSGGILLLVPGFITDALGLLLLFPLSRHVARAALKRRFSTRIYRFGPGPSSNVIDV